MVLKNATINHSESGFHSALNVDKDTVILCRERIFFSHFANTLQSTELFESREDAPREFTTVTGDLQRTLRMISDPLEYEVTLINFLSFHRLATEAFKHWRVENMEDEETRLERELFKLITKLKRAKDKEEEDESKDGDDIHGDINLDTVMERVNLVKKSNYNFSKYMSFLGYPEKKNFDDVDRMINGLFD